MSNIESIDQIESVIVHWSESTLINDELGCDDNSDIEKQVYPVKLDELISRAAQLVDSGYDKTSLTIKLKSGLIWCKEHKFYLTSNRNTLLKLINTTP